MASLEEFTQPSSLFCQLCLWRSLWIDSFLKHMRSMEAFSKALHTLFVFLFFVFVFLLTLRNVLKILVRISISKEWRWSDLYRWSRLWTIFNNSTRKIACSIHYLKIQRIIISSFLIRQWVFQSQWTVVHLKIIHDLGDYCVWSSLQISSGTFIYDPLQMMLEKFSPPSLVCLVWSLQVRLDPQWSIAALSRLVLLPRVQNRLHSIVRANFFSHSATYFLTDVASWSLLYHYFLGKCLAESRFLVSLVPIFTTRTRHGVESLSFPPHSKHMEKISLSIFPRMSYFVQQTAGWMLPLKLKFFKLRVNQSFYSSFRSPPFSFLLHHTS